MCKVVIYTTYDKNYAPYFPVWKRCIELSYPEYSIVGAEVVSTTRYTAAIMRFLDFSPIKEPFDYVYVTDIDMMIMREPVPLARFHIAEMELEGLCYSNTPRQKERLGAYRLTGLHFCNNEWIEKTKKARLKYMAEIFAGKIGTDDPSDDEQILMKICKESGLEIPLHKHLTSRHHGIHLGTIRGKENTPWSQTKVGLRQRIKPELCAAWLRAIQDKQLADAIKEASKVAWMGWQFQTLEKFCRGWTNGQV